MSRLRLIYLALAVWGLIHPMSFYIIWFNENGYSLSGLMGAWFVNPATSGLTWNLAISAFALTVWTLAETYVRKNWFALISIPATLLIGIGFGFPLYLFLRTRPAQ